MITCRSLFLLLLDFKVITKIDDDANGERKKEIQRYLRFYTVSSGTLSTHFLFLQNDRSFRFDWPINQFNDFTFGHNDERKQTRITIYKTARMRIFFSQFGRTFIFRLETSFVCCCCCLLDERAAAVAKFKAS